MFGCAASYPEALNPDQEVPAEVPAFLDADEAAIFIGHPDVFFIDARPGRVYGKGHVPGAVQLDWTKFTDRAKFRPTGKLDPDIDHLAGAIGALGLRATDWVVVIGDPATMWGEEGRVAWVLAFLGHSKVSIVDGGWSSWVAAGQPVQRGRIKRPEATYEAKVRYGVRASMKDVRDWVDRDRSWSRVLVDTRSRDEYQALPGAPGYGASRDGHIPGAVHLEWKELLGDDGKLLPSDQLEPILIGRGVRPDAEIITYCTGGVRSAHTWYVLRSLGYPSVRSYGGSWWEWALDRSNPTRPGSGMQPPPAPPWPPE